MPALIAARVSLVILLIQQPNLLERLSRSVAPTTRIAFDSETETVWREGHGSAIETHRELTRCTFRRDGNRMEAFRQTWKIEGEGESARKALLQSSHFLLLEGRLTILQDATELRPRGAGGITTADPVKSRQLFMASLGGCEALDGFLFGDGATAWPEIMREAGDAGAEGKNDSDAAVVRKGPRGQYRVWTNSDNTRPTRVEAVKTAEDLFAGRQLRETRYRIKGVGESAMRECRVSVQDIRYETINGSDIPSAARITMRQDYENGGYLEWEHRHTRRNIKVGPNAFPEDAFRPLAPEGTRYADQDTRGIIYVLKDGQLERNALEADHLVPRP